MGRKGRPLGGFFICGEGKDVRTYVYIDGYNLYYGRLRRTPYKWLDIYSLFANFIIREQTPQAIVSKVKFFTADIRTNLATHGKEAGIAQQSYHRALQQCYPDKIDIIKGYYAIDQARLPRYKKPPDRNDSVTVWKLEEKQTDVNLALHLYRDAVVKQHCEQIVIVSNDTDIAHAVELLREDTSNDFQIGIVIPIPKIAPGKPHRPPNEQLSKHADWTRRHILDEELAASQLPATIPTRKKPILKPNYW